MQAVSTAYTLRIDPVVVLTETNKAYRAARQAAAELIIKAKEQARDRK